MADGTMRRQAQLVDGVLRVLSDHRDGLPVKEVVARVRAAVPPTPVETSGRFTRLGMDRYERLVRQAALTVLRAGWLTAHRGRWALTSDGEAAYARHPGDPEGFLRAAAAHRGRGGPLPSVPASRDGGAVALAAAESAGAATTPLGQTAPEEFRELIAPLIESKGYHVLWIAPAGTAPAGGAAPTGAGAVPAPQVMDVRPTASSTAPSSHGRPEPRGTRRRWWRIAAGAGVAVLGVSSGVVVLHTWHPGSTPGRAAVAGPPAGGTVAFPTAAESALQARFPAFVEGCHRYPNHYARAVAEVECSVAPDHPGATSIVYQSFANYQDLEEHFHHVLALTIQTETGRPLTAAFTGACSDAASRFFSLSNYPASGETQDLVSSPTARGHVVCYLDTFGIPHIAWTNVGWLVVAQAAGDGAGRAAQNGLLALWEFAGPTGTPEPDLAVTRTPAALVTALYQQYLLREPEDGTVLEYWVRRLTTVGFAEVSNELASSAEAKVRITLPITQGLGHGH
jgi:hypothetical protein